MEPVIDHIEITVRDMGTAVPFYDRFLPLLGFDLARRSEAVIEGHEKHVVSYYALYFKDPEGIKYEIVCTD